LTRDGVAPPGDFARLLLFDVRSDGYTNRSIHPADRGTDVNQTSQRELGGSDRPIEDELEDAFARMVDEGTQRLHRTWREVLVTGFFGGTEVAMGVLAYLSVLHATKDPLLAGLAFSIGFLALLLGRSELFTEGFLVPVTTVAAKRASVRQLVKLWTGTLVANLVGGWVLMWLIMTAFPKLSDQTIESATHYIAAPISAETLTLTLLGGMAITLMTRMQHGTDSMFGKIAAAVAGAFLLAGLQMFHSILDSLLIFGALATGRSPFGYLSWLQWFGYTALGNVVGGLLLVTLLRLLRSKDRLQEERVEAEQTPDNGDDVVEPQSGPAANQK
jgi:formate/nitrite transporter FocA (FNT family)